MRALPQASRRDFLRLAGGASLAAGLPAGWARSAPQRGGHFRVGLTNGRTTDGLDPATHANDYMHTLISSIHKFLTEIDHYGTLRGELAESRESTPDAATWVIRLRPGVTFQNSKTVTAEDVIASINHHRGEASKSGEDDRRRHHRDRGRRPGHGGDHA